MSFSPRLHFPEKNEVQHVMLDALYFLQSVFVTVWGMTMDWTCRCFSVAQSNSLWPHGLKHARLPCPSVSPSLLRLMSIESVMLSIHLILCCSLSPFAFSLSQHQGVFRWVGTAASATVLPMNVQGWFPLGLTDPISLLSKGLSRVFSNTTIWKHQYFRAQPSVWSNSHIHI